MIINKTSPAKIFPNNLNENDINLAISDKNSSMPTKKLTGLEKLKNFLKCVKTPNIVTPKKFVTNTDITAKAKVKFKSAAGDLKRGTPACSFLKMKEPTPGSKPNQFDNNIKTKIVKTKGKYFSDFSFDPKTDSIKLKNISINISIAP